MDSLGRHEDYGQESLDESQLATNPIEQFRNWLVSAEEAGIYEPNAFVLSTVTSENTPSSRTVLLKGVEDNGFVFFTNFSSRKGQAIEQNPHVSAVFGWYSIYRQVLIEGTVERVSEDDSEEYFHSRPHESQVAAWSSRQSEPIESRSMLDEQFDEALKRFDGQVVPKPDYWGGYRIVPSRIEFWKGRSNRMHDRIAFARTPEAENWKVTRLQP
jgi:pyridoxamine 5'-phosphate oxidase